MNFDEFLRATMTAVRYPPDRRNVICVSDETARRLAEQIKSSVSIPATANAFMGLELLTYPNGTTIFNMKTNERVVIDDGSALLVNKNDIIVIPPGDPAA